MALQLGDTAPDFNQESTDGPISFHQWAGDNWVVLFSHPKDFTPVCTTELGEVARLKPEFEKRNAKVIGLSVDPLDDHKAWCGDIEETQGQALNFPLLADADRKVANLYGMIHPNANDTLTGRNFDEILRVIDSLQLTDGYKVATPVNWNDGDDVIIVPSLSNEDAQKLFPEGWDEKKPYLRMVKQPKTS